MKISVYILLSLKGDYEWGILFLALKIQRGVFYVFQANFKEEVSDELLNSILRIYLKNLSYIIIALILI